MTIIGVTGHRFLANLDKLVHSVDKALALIEAHYDPLYICLSALAEGADRLVPHRAFARWEEARLIVPLPLDVDDYMQDFKTLTSKADFINLMTRVRRNHRAPGYLQPGGRVSSCGLLCGSKL